MDRIIVQFQSPELKTKYAGAVSLLSLLKQLPASTDFLFDEIIPLIPELLKCLKSHNSKLALTVLEILQILIGNVNEQVVRGHFKLIWINLVDRLGDNKLQIREKAVDVVIALTEKFGFLELLDKIKQCMEHKNWRTREQALHSLWRCLEHHRLFFAMKHEVLGDVLRLLEDSSKEVRLSAMTSLEHFYTALGSSFIDELETKKIRTSHMKELVDRFHKLPANENEISANSSPDSEGEDSLPSNSSTAFILSMQKRQMLNAASSRSTLDSKSVADKQVSKSTDGIEITPSEKETIKILTTINDELNIDNDWLKRVAGMKKLQELAEKFRTSNFHVVPHSERLGFSQSLKIVRKNLDLQVGDLRSSVTREACLTIQLLASVLSDDFNQHAEFFVNSLLKATYVTIQVISAAAISCLKCIIASTNIGYGRLIPKFIDGSSSRNQVLRLNCVACLTWTLQQWQVGTLIKFIDLYVGILPSVLQDAFGDVRAQSRKCFWAFKVVFPGEGQELYNKLSISAQKYLRADDTSNYNNGVNIKTSDKHHTISRTLSSSATLNDQSSGVNAINLKPNQLYLQSTTTSQRVPLQRATDNGPQRSNVSNTILSVSHLRQRCDNTMLSGTDGILHTVHDINTSQTLRQVQNFDETSHNVLDTPSSGADTKSMSNAMRIGEVANSSCNDKKNGSQRVWNNAPKRVPVGRNALEKMYAIRQESDTSGSAVGFHIRNNSASPPNSAAANAFKAGRVPLSFPTDSNLYDASQSDVNSDTSSSVATIIDQLEEAVKNSTNPMWAIRLEATQCIGNLLESNNDTIDRALYNSKHKLDEKLTRVLVALLSDGHYRVAHRALEALPSLIDKVSQAAVLPYMKVIIPNLFQKSVDTKESIRSLATKGLHSILKKLDASILTGIVLQLLDKESKNMKIKASICRYLREILPQADSYFSSSTNHMAMKGLLIRLARILEADQVPHSVLSSCIDLLYVTAECYKMELHTVLPLMTRNKREVLVKALSERGIDISSAQLSRSSLLNRVPLPMASSGSSSPSMNMDHDDYQKVKDVDMELHTSQINRKSTLTRNFKASSSPRTQKRPRTSQQSESGLENSQQKLQDTSSTAISPTTTIGGDQPDSENSHEPIYYDMQRFSLDGNESIKKANTMTFDNSPIEKLTQYGAHQNAKKGLLWEMPNLLQTLESNNVQGDQCRKMIRRIRDLIVCDKSDQTSLQGFWDTYFERLMNVLLECEKGNDWIAVHTLQHLLTLHPKKSRMLLYRILSVLIEWIDEDSSDLSNDLKPISVFLMLQPIVTTTENPEATLQVLVNFISAKASSSTLEVVLKLIAHTLTAASKLPSKNLHSMLLQKVWITRLLKPLAKYAVDAKPAVRKGAVDCFVGLHLVTHGDSMLNTFMGTELDVTTHKVVNVYINRLKV